MKPNHSTREGFDPRTGGTVCVLTAIVCGAVGLSPAAKATEPSPATIAEAAESRIEKARADYDASMCELQASREALLSRAKHGAEALGEARAAYRRCRAEKILVCMDELIASSDESGHVARFASDLLAKDFEINQALAAMVNEVSLAVREGLEVLQLLGPRVAVNPEHGKRAERELMDRLFTVRLFDDLTEEDLDEEGNLNETTRLRLGSRLVEMLQSLSLPPDEEEDARAHLRAQLEEIGLAALGLGILRQREAQFIAADWRALVAIAVQRRFRLEGMEQANRFDPGVTVYPFPPTDGSLYRKSVIKGLSEQPRTKPMRSPDASDDAERQRRRLLSVRDVERDAYSSLQSTLSTAWTPRR